MNRRECHKAVRRQRALGKRLAFMLSDFRAFEEYPAMRQVLEAILEDGSGKWLKE